MFSNADMIEIKGKEVKSIILQNGGILYEKKELSMVFSFIGNQFPILGNDFTGDNIIFDWGDGGKTRYINGNIYYYQDEELFFTNESSDNILWNYNDEKEIHTIKIFNVTEIKDFAFESKNINDVFIFPYVTEIGLGSFSQCPLTNVTLSEGLTSIGVTCFSETNLTKIIIPSTVTSLKNNCLGSSVEEIGLLWNTTESIIPYSTDTYSQLSTDYKFRIPEGTKQLYLDKGYPLEKLLEGVTAITLTSDKNIVSIGEKALITAILDYPSQDKIIIFNTKTPESVTMFPGNNYYSIGENGFDITNFNNNFSLTSNIDNGYYLYISYFEDNYGRKILLVFVKRENGSSSAIIRNITYPIRLHVDENNIIVYYYEDYEQQEVIYLTRNLPSSKYLNKYIKEEGFTQWQLSGNNSLTVTKNTGLSTLTDSNGQATMEYNGIGAGNITIKGTYLDKNISNTITIQDLNTPTLYLNSDKESIIKGETTLLTTSFSISQENETVYLSKIINDENLTLELTSTNSGLNHEIKTKVTDENDNGLENIRIKLYKEE